eukprot:COSAG02_NODE_1928_length_10338_cov_85.895888_9_plen_210_part_00
MGFSRAGIGVFVVAALGFSRVGIGVFVVAALGFLGAGIGVFVVAALVFLGVGIGVFECRHWCFCGRGIGVFVGRGIWVCRARYAGAAVSFSGRKSGAAQKKRENANAQTRSWTSKWVLVGDDFMRECRRVAGPGRGCVRRIQADQPPRARRRRRRRTRAAARPAPAPERVTTRGPATEVRQSSGALAAWRRWQHGSDDSAADSTSMTGY